jgi:hypothetical protein
MNKSQKQLLSVLFHLAVLGGMVMAYDAGKSLAQKFGWIKDPGKAAVESTTVDLMAEEEQLSNEIDPELAKLVTKKGDALVFRRDLKFPPHLKVIATDITKLKKVRFAGKSEFGQGSMVLSVRGDKIMEYEMAGGAVRFTMKENVREKIPTAQERVAKLKLVEEALKNKQAPPDTRDRILDPLVGKVVQFKYVGKAWKAESTREFKTMAWGKGLEENVTQNLVENSMLPRPRWFGTDPIKPGEVTKLSGKSLNLIMDGIGQGEVELTLKGMEGVHGHPCAVFEVTGSYVADETENAAGQTVESELTIEKGRVWCSLLFPIVLRSDMDLIVSSVTREGSKVVSRMQGPVNRYVHHEWKAVTKEAKKTTPPKPPGMK